jgi:hypothetical protein
LIAYNFNRQSDPAITPPGLLTLLAPISLTSKERREKMLMGSYTKRNDKKNGANKRYDELQQREKAYPFG